jgi:hypothetical protein
MDIDGRSAAKAPEAGSHHPPPKARGLKPHQIVMLLIMALAVVMIVGGISSALWETRNPASAPG